MFGSPILDLVILLSFIYFIGSLILSAINEAIAGTLRLRPKQLQTSLEQLFFGTCWTAWVQGTFFKSPHIQSLMKSVDRCPSYIPAKNFCLAVIGELGAANYTPGNLQIAISSSSLPDEFKKVLADLAAQGANDLTAFEKNLEEFYNNAMERAGGVYKKQIRLLLILFALFISVALNLDTLKIAKDELSNKAKLSQDVDNIVKQVPAIKMNKDTNESVTIKTSTGVITVDRTLQPTAKGDTSISHNVKAVGQLSMYLMQNSGYTTGYSEGGGFQKQWFDSPPAFFIKLLGILITAFALQLSSGFWFDLMSKAVNIRAAGKKPDTTKKPNKHGDS